MTPDRKQNNTSHSHTLPAHGRVAATHTHRLSGNNRQRMFALSSGIVTRSCHQNGGDTSRFHAYALDGADRSPCVHGRTRPGLRNSDSTARDCAGAFPVRSTALLRGGVSSWEPNQYRDGRRCLGERFEHLFEETRDTNDCRSLAASVASCGATRSPMSSWRNAPAARSARRNSTSPASASLPTKRSWSCSTNYGPASGPDKTPGGEVTASSRRSIAGVGTDGAASASASHLSYLLATGDPASVQGGERGRSFARTAGINSKFIPPGPIVDSIGQRYRDGRLQRELPSPRLRRESGGVTPTAQVTQATEGRRAEVQGCAAVAEGRGKRPTHFSSGDGLGIQQPGSFKRGTRAKVQTPSGRARDRAMCPAVARFIQGRVG